MGFGRGVFVVFAADLFFGFDMRRSSSAYTSDSRVTAYLVTSSADIDAEVNS